MTVPEQPADPIRTILVPTDGSDAAGSALERALQLAALADAAVHVLTVVDTTTNPLRFGVAEVVELDRAANELVDELVDACEDRNVEVHSSIRRGRPTEAILSYADENAIDLIVVGRTGCDGVAETLLGSTTDRLVRQASAPVVVVPESESIDDGNRGTGPRG